MKDSQLGIFVPQTKTLYVLIESPYIKESVVIDKLRRIVSARDLVNLNQKDLSGGKDQSNFVDTVLPRIMKVSEAKAKGYEIVELPGSEAEAKRLSKQPEETKKNGTLFGANKQNTGNS